MKIFGFPSVLKRVWVAVMSCRLYVEMNGKQSYWSFNAVKNLLHSINMTFNDVCDNLKLRQQLFTP
ncbi:MAG: hypothetical protein JWP45_2839 [Mucilaginibacter sp.]|nr:hypothetical protein [Mucilaginibacter sp.]